MSFPALCSPPLSIQRNQPIYGRRPYIAWGMVVVGLSPAGGPDPSSADTGGVPQVIPLQTLMYTPDSGPVPVPKRWPHSRHPCYVLRLRVPSDHVTGLAYHPYNFLTSFWRPTLSNIPVKTSRDSFRQAGLGEARSPSPA